MASVHRSEWKMINDTIKEEKEEQDRNALITLLERVTAIQEANAGITPVKEEEERIPYVSEKTQKNNKRGRK